MHGRTQDVRHTRIQTAHIERMDVSVRLFSEASLNIGPARTPVDTKGRDIELGIMIHAVPEVFNAQICSHAGQFDTVNLRSAVRR